MLELFHILVQNGASTNGETEFMHKLFALAVAAVTLMAISGLSPLLADDSDRIILAQSVGNRIGEISDGFCTCKVRCGTGNSEFSQQGRPVSECRRMCEDAYSGCKAGEVRSREKRK